MPAPHPLSAHLPMPEEVTMGDSEPLNIAKCGYCKKMGNRRYMIELINGKLICDNCQSRHLIAATWRSNT